MSEQYKYEPIFGDQSLFDGAPEDAEAVGGGEPYYDAVVFYKFSNGEFQYKYKEETSDWKMSTCKHPQTVIKAMRRTIPEPKRWTVEDKKAGQLPDVGSKAVSVHGFCVVDILAVRNGCVVACNSDISDARPCVFTIDNFLELYTPIESPEEKAARLRNKWCNRAMDYSTIQQLYDAMLSGDLPVPVKG